MSTSEEAFGGFLPIALESDDTWPAAGNILVCPACGYDYSHIRSCHTALGNDKYEGGKAYPGTEARGVTPFRRDCLVITLDGECEHAWEIRIQQHKGINYVWTRLVAPVAEDVTDDALMKKEPEI